MSSMTKRLKFILPMVVFLCLGFLLWRGLSVNPSELPSELVGKPVPEFKLNTLLDENKQVTQADFIGNISVINVWASWCVACMLEHPFLMQQSNTTDVQLYGFNYRDERDSARQWINKWGNPYILSLFDGDGRVAIDWGIYGTPETFIVDNKGIIRYRHIGLLDQEKWDSTIQPLINKLKDE